MVFLDLSLESYTRQLTESVMHVDLGFEQYVHEAGIIMDNLVLSYGKSWSELQNIASDFNSLVQDELNDNPEWSLSEDTARKMKSVVDRMKGALAEVNTTIEDVM